MFDFILIPLILWMIIILTCSYANFKKHLNYTDNVIYYPDGTLADHVDRNEFPLYINDFMIDIINGEITVFKFVEREYKLIKNVTAQMNLLKKFNI